MGTFIISDFTSTDTTARIVREDYAADSFTRPGPALGSTEIGGYAWQQNAGSVHEIVDNHLLLSSIPGTSQSMAWFNEIHADGVLSGTIVESVTNPNRGLMLGYNAATGTAYVLVSDGTNYSIRARSNSGGLTTLATSSGIKPMIGDQLEFEVVGTVFRARANGVQIMSISNAVYTLGQGKGVWAFANGGSTTVRVGWDNIAWSEI